MKVAKIHNIGICEYLNQFLLDVSTKPKNALMYLWNMMRRYHSQNAPSFFYSV